MKFLVDNALPPGLAQLLIDAGYDAVHVAQYDMCGASDEAIIVRGQEEGRIIVSADSDFGALLALQEAARPSFIFFREPNSLRARDYFEKLAPVLESLRVELAAGCVVVFRNGRIRLRRLPFQIGR